MILFRVLYIGMGALLGLMIGSLPGLVQLYRNNAAYAFVAAEQATTPIVATPAPKPTPVDAPEADICPGGKVMWRQGTDWPALGVPQP